MKNSFPLLCCALLLAGCQSARSIEPVMAEPATPATSNGGNLGATSAENAASPMKIYDYDLQTLDGKPADMSKYKGKVLLVVNTASKCGYTRQYAGLQAISEKYKAQGLEVLGFPANNFGGQEPGSAEEIGEFCQKNFGVTFDLFAKSSVKGEDKSPFFTYLTEQANPEKTGDISWNFEKFLISRDGRLVDRYKSAVEPNSDELTAAIETQLNQN